VPFVYHDSRTVRCGRYLWCGRDRGSGEQMADSDALVLWLFATNCAHLRVAGCRYRISSAVGTSRRVYFSDLVARRRVTVATTVSFLQHRRETLLTILSARELQSSLDCLETR